MLSRIIYYSFFFLLLGTPLFFTPFNNELFEFNKMILVYLMTIIISGCWVLKMVNQKSLIINRTPLDIPILLFLASQFLATIFSIDPHTSWWGYYSRSNGGLLSILSYIILYYALVSNITRDQTIKLLKATLLGGFLVSLWAIPEHFGVSPSCILLTHTVTADCWVQDVQSRVFATLGQPNWLAAYLAMIIFPAIYFFITSQNWRSKSYYLVLTICYYLAFTFTYSRGATLGFLIGLIIFVILILLPTVKDKPVSFTKNIFLKPLLIIVGIFVILNLYFGSALTSFRLEKKSVEARPSILQTAVASGNTQLETGGTESGSIRLIVWQGAFDIWKHYPLFGSGVETFAYSYYNFRPQEHNLVSEWDFLYNKAHNEYLNYLATTGIFGLATYLAMIGTFFFWCVKYYVSSIKQKSHDTDYLILTTSLIAGYISYLVQNFFGFSVVIIALLFYLFPAFVFNTTLEPKSWIFPDQIGNFLKNILNATVFRSKVSLKITQGIIIIIIIVKLFNVINVWQADTYYKKGADQLDSGNPNLAYNYLIRAAIQNSDEPLYRSELGLAASGAALTYKKDDASLSGELKEEAINQTRKALAISPRNLSIHRTAVRTYYQLSALDESFLEKTLVELDDSIKLAPTDPKLYYNKALVLGNEGRLDQAIDVLKQVIAIKPNYREAYLSLGYFYAEKKDYDKARAALQSVLKLVPNDPEALEKLKEIKNK